jgi:hypothetical protein
MDLRLLEFYNLGKAAFSFGFDRCGINAFLLINWLINKRGAFLLWLWSLSILLGR